MRCPMGAGGPEFLASMLMLKAILVIWVLIVPLMFLKRLDKLLKILEDKKK